MEDKSFETAYNHFKKRFENKNRVQLQNMLHVSAEELAFIYSHGRLEDVIYEMFDEFWGGMNEEERIDHLHRISEDL